MPGSPLTPLHIGPAATIGLPLRHRIHFPTFIVANIAPDLEPLTVLILGLRYPIHGYLHTFLAAAIAGAALGLIMWGMKRWFRSLYRLLYLEPPNYGGGPASYIVAGAVGWGIHVLLDSPLYPDIRPLYPYLPNPLYAPWLYRWVNIACVVMIVAGLLMYVYVVIRESSGSRGK